MRVLMQFMDLDTSIFETEDKYNISALDLGQKYSQNKSSEILGYELESIDDLILEQTANGSMLTHEDEDTPRIFQNENVLTDIHTVYTTNNIFYNKKAEDPTVDKTREHLIKIKPDTIVFAPDVYEITGSMSKATKLSEIFKCFRKMSYYFDATPNAEIYFKVFDILTERSDTFRYIIIETEYFKTDIKPHIKKPRIIQPDWYDIKFKYSSFGFTKSNLQLQVTEGKTELPTLASEYLKAFQIDLTLPVTLQDYKKLLENVLLHSKNIPDSIFNVIENLSYDNEDSKHAKEFIDIYLNIRKNILKTNPITGLALILRNLLSHVQYLTPKSNLAILELIILYFKAQMGNISIYDLMPTFAIVEDYTNEFDKLHKCNHFDYHQMFLKVISDIKVKDTNRPGSYYGIGMLSKIVNVETHEDKAKLFRIDSYSNEQIAKLVQDIETRNLIYNRISHTYYTSPLNNSENTIRIKAITLNLYKYLIPEITDLELSFARTNLIFNSNPEDKHDIYGWFRLDFKNMCKENPTLTKVLIIAGLHTPVLRNMTIEWINKDMINMSEIDFIQEFEYVSRELVHLSAIVQFAYTFKYDKLDESIYLDFTTREGYLTLLEEARNILYQFNILDVIEYINEAIVKVDSFMNTIETIKTKFDTMMKEITFEEGDDSHEAYNK